MLKEKLKTRNIINKSIVGADDPVCPKKPANEPIANVVGVAPQGDPHFEEPTQNKNLISNLQPLTSNYKGITLIALIITIIVMLILVGVTISVALNGGLFKKANTAVTQTQKEVDRETLLSEVTASLNDNLEIPKLDALTSNLPNGWKAEGTDGGPYTCTSPNGNIFTVTLKGEITDNSNSDNPGTNKKNYYEFTLGDLINLVENGKASYSEGIFSISANEFWPEDVSDELKQGYEIDFMGSGSIVTTFNITCDYSWINLYGMKSTELDASGVFGMLLDNGSINILVCVDGWSFTSIEEMKVDFPNVKFRIDLP